MRHNINIVVRISRQVRQVLLLSALLLTVFMLEGCSNDGPGQHDYQIIINGSATRDPVQYSASYACLENASEVVHDISGSGSEAYSFRCEKLIRVRLQRILGVGLVSLSVYADGVAVFETPPTDSASPLLYVAPR